MPLAHAANLLNELQDGRKITTAERRLCLQYLMATQPELTNAKLGEMFGVSERTLRVDKQKIRSQKAKFLKDELSNDLALVIADVAMDFERQVGDLEKSKAKSPLGKRAYVDHCNAIFDMRLKMIKAFQDIGYLPKNLGSMTVEKFSYKASVSLDGSVSTRTEEQFSPKELTAMDAEFTDIPKALPSGEDNLDSPIELEVTAKE